MSWKCPERPESVVAQAYRLAVPFGPFTRVVEFGTNRTLAITYLSTSELETTEERLLGSQRPLPYPADLVIALHVLEHTEDTGTAVADLWRCSTDYLLVEVPALEAETPEQAFDDINPGHLHHLSMGDLIQAVGGAVMACEAVRHGPWPCNRLLAHRNGACLAAKQTAADIIYGKVAEIISKSANAGDAYLGDGYSMRQLLKAGVPALPVYDTFKRPAPEYFNGRFILTPRYLPTRLEMIEGLNHTQSYIDPWEKLAHT
jgi:hypothetical protein